MKPLKTWHKGAIIIAAPVVLLFAVPSLLGQFGGGVIPSAPPGLTPAVVGSTGVNGVVMDGGVAIATEVDVQDGVGLAHMAYKYVGTLGGQVNPEFDTGYLFNAGVGLTVWTLWYQDAATLRKKVFVAEQSGTLASVGDNTRRSHYEYYDADGMVNPGFRQTSYPHATMEIGAGGAVSVSMTRTGGNLVTWSTGSIPHDFTSGDLINITCSDPNFAGGTNISVTVIDGTDFSYTQAGANVTSTATCQASEETDFKIRRLAENQIAFIMGPYSNEITKIIFYADSIATQANYDMAIGGGIIYNTSTFNHAASPVTMGQIATYLCDATAGAVVLDLPAASAKNGRYYMVSKIDSSGNTCTVTRAGSDTVNSTGAIGATTFALSSQGNSVTLTSDGVSKWWVLAKQ